MIPRTLVSVAPFRLRTLRSPLYVALALVLAGCAQVGYYTQAVRGHLEILSASRAIDDVLADAATPEPLRRRLQLILDARAFATTALGLPDNGSYRAYADIERPYVVWNVFAAPPLSLQLEQSCFFVVGCLSYRGYFQAAAAERLAAELRDRGLDVFVGGVVAYSTLGWFADPVLNTMLRWDDVRLIKTLFHELAHQRLYVKDDTDFNESFATAVGEIGLERWLAARGHDAGVVLEEQRDREFLALVKRYRDRLQSVYDGAETVADKQRLKAATLDALRADYAELKASWNGLAAYDRWISEDLNNAKLASVATYHDYVGSFRAILELVDRDLTRFYARAAAVGALDVDARHRCLAELTASAGVAPTCIGRAR